MDPDPDPSSSFQNASEDPLLGGIPDSFFEEVTMLEEDQDPLFEGIADEFFDEVMPSSTAAKPSSITSNEDDLFGDIEDDLFNSISPRGPSFLSLPPEIRNMIYDLVFVSPAYVGTNGTSNKSFFNDAVKWRNLDFAMSCRQVYAESGTIFYSRNGFEFYYIRPFKAFMESIGIEGRRLITKLNFNFLKGSPFCTLRYIRSCTNIQQLNISLRVMKPNCESQGWWLYPIKNAKDFLFTEFNKLEFGEASGIGEARDSEARGECMVALREKNALFRALNKVKYEDIYTQNGPYPSIFAQRRSARQIAEEYRELSERFEWQECTNYGEIELNSSSTSLPALMLELFNQWG